MLFKLIRSVAISVINSVIMKGKLSRIDRSSLRNSSSQKDFERLVVLFSANEHAELDAQANALVKAYPKSGFVWKVLGASLEKQGKDSLPAMYKSVEYAPSDEQAWLNLGLALKRRGRYKEMVEVLRQALASVSDKATIYDHLGLAQLHMGLPAEAESSFCSALAIDSFRANTHCNLGLALRAQGKIEQALTSFLRSLEISPDDANALNCYGAILMDNGCYERAEDIFRRALIIDSNNIDVLNNLAFLLYKKLSQAESLDIFRKIIILGKTGVSAFDNLLHVLSTQGGENSAEYLDWAKRYGALVAQGAEPYGSWKCSKDPIRQLRIGLVSGDFRNHAVGHFIDGVIQSLKKNKSTEVSVYAYSNSFYFDEVSERISSNCSEWKEVFGFSDEQLATTIYDDAVDILVDLSGHTSGNRLPVFAWKPAPIQVSWLGYWATTGVAEIDWLVADSLVLPDTETPYYTEKIWYLPETRFCFTDPNLPVKINELPAKKNGYVTFGCFNRLEKITDEVVAVWSDILNQVAGSRIYLKSIQLNEPTSYARIVRHFSKYGVDSSKFILEGFSDRQEYLSAYQKVDFALDPFPFTGGTTTVEGLWMGVPVLTLAGKSMLSRQGVGLLTNAGLTEWIAQDTKDYVMRAIAFASDLEGLASLRCSLRQQVLASPIFDSDRFADHLESAFRGMWENWSGAS